MDILQHTLHGGLMGLPSGDIKVIAAGALIGGCLDVVGYVEKVVKRDRNVWSWYLWVHRLSWRNPFCYLPPSLLHILLDSVTHGEGKRWWKLRERLWAEVLAWAITLLIIIFWGIK